MQKDRCTLVEVERDTNLRKALIDAKIDIYTLGGKLRNCGGAGQCGTCVVEVEDGAYGLSPPTAKEDILLSSKPESFRLACRATVNGDCTIRTKPKM
ncbi:ferredoxin [Gracilaria domingensis]|nr:ferredoxin [Gracilaria domingensis]